MDSEMQEYYPVLVLAVLGLFAFIVGMFFALRERRERAERARKQQELNPNLQKSA
jgi:preprotein translocase subunit YajC